jgi:coiled-coil and C2 domain-containing protein 2A
MDDLVYLHVYDEVAIDLLEDDRRRETDIHQRFEKRWLGSITIPFSTLYTNGRVGYLGLIVILFLKRGF